jgi:hypothetical protein
MLKLVALLLVPPVLFLMLVASSSFLVVDVQETGPKGMHVIVPVPLVFAQAALAFVPAGTGHVELPSEARENLPLARKLLDALAEAPDGELVSVEDRRERVTISKLRGTLRVEVHGDHEDVSVNLPMGAASDVLREFEGGSVDAAAIVSALRGVSHTDLVEVHGRNEHVKLWIW